MDKTIGQQRTEVIYKDDEEQKNSIQEARDMVAELIDFADTFSRNSQDGEARRCHNTAMTNFEQGLMWLIKGITK